jgi:hypothetical protein
MEIEGGCLCGKGALFGRRRAGLRGRVPLQELSKEHRDRVRVGPRTAEADADPNEQP